MRRTCRTRQQEHFLLRRLAEKQHRSMLMYQTMDGCNLGGGGSLLLRDVFLFGEEGIPLQDKRVVNRFVNFKDDQILIWLMHHQNRQLVHLPGVVLPLYGDWSFNFWHWCNEALPVALVAHEAGFSGTYLVPNTPFAAQSLNLLGIRPDRIRVVEECDYHLECMCLLTKLQGHDETGLEARQRISAIFRAQFAGKAPQGRLYLSRNGNEKNLRKVVGEEGLLALLERFGFTMLRMEELSLSEQLSHTCNADALLGPHGAGMAHCAFMPPGSLVVELFPPTYINPCIVLPCRALKHRYFQLTSHCHYAGYGHGFDIEPPMELLEMTLERELSIL